MGEAAHATAGHATAGLHSTWPFIPTLSQGITAQASSRRLFLLTAVVDANTGCLRAFVGADLATEGFTVTDHRLGGFHFALAR